MSAPRDDRARGRARGEHTPLARPGGAAADGEEATDPYLRETYSSRGPYAQDLSQNPYGQDDPYRPGPGDPQASRRPAGEPGAVGRDAYGPYGHGPYGSGPAAGGTRPAGDPAPYVAQPPRSPQPAAAPHSRVHPPRDRQEEETPAHGTDAAEAGGRPSVAPPPLPGTPDGAPPAGSVGAGGHALPGAFAAPGQQARESGQAQGYGQQQSGRQGYGSQGYGPPEDGPGQQASQGYGPGQYGSEEYGSGQYGPGQYGSKKYSQQGYGSPQDSARDRAGSPYERIGPYGGPTGSSSAPGGGDPSWDTGTREYGGAGDLFGASSAPPGATEAPGRGAGDWYGEVPSETTDTIPLIAGAPAQEAEQAGESIEAAGGGRGGGLLSSSAIMAAGTLVSRATGFLRTMIIAAAIGIGVMGDSYQVANTLPTMLYILTGGGALNAVFVPQLVRSMKSDEDGGNAYANRLLTLVVVFLAGITFLTVLGAPLLLRVMSDSLMRDHASAATTVALARYCLPTIFFMGVHVVMGQILNARGRFGAMMWTPVLNNVVVIATFGAYIAVFGTFGSSGVTPATVSPEGVRLLGVGTLLGLAVQALSMIPYLREAGFRFQPRFDWRGHGLGKAARLAKWTFLYVLANQAGYLVVTQLATSAGETAARHGHQGAGLAAYSNALLIWQLPQAVITVSVMSAVLPRISRAAADGDITAVRDDLSYGLRSSAVAIVPAAFAFLALGPWIGTAIYGIGGHSGTSGQGFSVGLMLSGFALGLIPYSMQYVLLRGFYAYEDTRTPFSNTVWVAATNAVLSALCYALLPSTLAVTGMALAYGAAYLVGVVVALPKLRRRIGDLDGRRVGSVYARLTGAAAPAAAAGFAVAVAVAGFSAGYLRSVTALVCGAVAMLGVFLLVAKRLRIEELDGLMGMVRGRLGR